MRGTLGGRLVIQSVSECVCDWKTEEAKKANGEDSRSSSGLVCLLLSGEATSDSSVWCLSNILQPCLWSTATITSAVRTSAAVGEAESGVIGTCNKDPCVYAGFLSEESLSLHH